MRPNNYSEEINWLINNVDTRTMLEQLAEECAELAHAALKLIRASELSDNPTPDSEETTLERLTEEASDVALVLCLLGVDVTDPRENRKAERWKDRLLSEYE